jgi:hypothetical protein
LHFESPKILLLHPYKRRREHRRMDIDKMHDDGKNKIKKRWINQEVKL